MRRRAKEQGYTLTKIDPPAAPTATDAEQADGGAIHERPIRSPDHGEPFRADDQDGKQKTRRSKARELRANLSALANRSGSATLAAERSSWGGKDSEPIKASRNSGPWQAHTVQRPPPPTARPPAQASCSSRSVAGKALEPPSGR
jgi:hypothetical protein